MGGWQASQRLPAENAGGSLNTETSFLFLRKTGVSTQRSSATSTQTRPHGLQNTHFCRGPVNATPLHARDPADAAGIRCVFVFGTRRSRLGVWVFTSTHIYSHPAYAHILPHTCPAPAHTPNQA